MGEINGGEISPPPAAPPPPRVAVVDGEADDAECLITDGTGERRIDRAESECFNFSFPNSPSFSRSTKGS